MLRIAVSVTQNNLKTLHNSRGKLKRRHSFRKLNASTPKRHTRIVRIPPQDAQQLLIGISGRQQLFAPAATSTPFHV